MMTSNSSRAQRSLWNGWAGVERVIVTGCCGSIGSALVSRLLAGTGGFAGEVVGLDNNEDGIFKMESQLEQEGRCRFYVADIRDVSTLRRRFSGAQVVLHCAALKHVYQCEKAPEQVVRTNVLGVEAAILAAREAGVQRVLFTSSDKAANPTSVMGTSKLMGERMITAANTDQTGTLFTSTRFGNVLGSRGSVVQIFREQIKAGGPVTLTNSKMTRFVMSVDQAVALVMESVELARGGEVFITKMPTLAIEDLARVMIQGIAPSFGHCSDAIAVEEVGARVGEKLYEELMTAEETRRAIELPDYFIVLPAFRGIYRAITYEYPNIRQRQVSRPYVSADEPRMSDGEIRQILQHAGLLRASDDENALI